MVFVKLNFFWLCPFVCLLWPLHVLFFCCFEVIEQLVRFYEKYGEKVKFIQKCTLFSHFRKFVIESGGIGINVNEDNCFTISDIIMKRSLAEKHLPLVFTIIKLLTCNCQVNQTNQTSQPTRKSGQYRSFEVCSKF